MNQDCLTLQKYGEYYLIHRIATGSDAEIWLACSYIKTKFRNFCAVKRVVFRESFDEYIEKKFLMEGKTSFQLRHPNIVTCINYGKLKSEEGKSVFLAMDYVFGKNLIQIQRDQQKDMDSETELSFILQVICSIAGALDYMHRFRNPYTLELEPIVHRDISPANVMVSYAGEIKVLDFGIAIQQGEDTPSNKSAGKITYMSPEQLAGQELSPCSDLYSLGIIFWELLCGQKLFEKTGERDRRIVCPAGSIIHPSKVNPEVNEELGDICMKCLQHNPMDRFIYVSDFYDSLSEWMLHKDYCKQGCVQKYMLKYFSDDFKECREFLKTIQEASPYDPILFKKNGRCEKEKSPYVKSDDVTLTTEEYSVTKTAQEYSKSIEANAPLSVEETQTITL